ncbi:hypothetical protein B0A55_04791, partial [Friedmanniomyces simplex]
LKMLQGVREIFELIDSASVSGESTEPPANEGKIVIIGRNIGSPETSASFQQSLGAALATS